MTESELIDEAITILAIASVFTPSPQVLAGVVNRLEKIDQDSRMHGFNDGFSKAGKNPRQPESMGR